MSSGKMASACSLFVVVLLCASAAPGVTIRQIQETADPDGASSYDGATVDCAGGIVLSKVSRTVPRLQLYDPADPTAWGGLQVKDLSVGAALFNAVHVGDWVSFAEIPVDEYRGTTFLQYDPVLATNVSFQVQSTGNALPSPVVLSPAEIAAPTETSPDFWLVADHSAEKYESMRVKIENVTVTAKDLGKAYDNYLLQAGAAGAWASDYLNPNAVNDYDPKVSTGQTFTSVTGILEQYTKIRDTYGWDYYQLLTTSTDDLVVPEPGSLLLLGCGVGWLVSRKRR